MFPPVNPEFCSNLLNLSPGYSDSHPGVVSLARSLGFRGPPSMAFVRLRDVEVASEEDAPVEVPFSGDGWVPLGAQEARALRRRVDLR